VPRKVFVAGEILTAADVNTNLMDQAVMVFDDAAARGSAIPSPSEGMVTYLKDTDQLEKYTTDWVAAGGKILQVVQGVKTDTFSTSSNSFTAITGLTATITPTSTSSKILILLDTKGSQSTGDSTAIHLRLTGGNSAAYIGGADGNRTRVAAGLGFGGDPGVQLRRGFFAMVANYLDSPATTSSVTYGVDIRMNGSGTVYINRSGEDTDLSISPRGASSITLMEVAG
jgi:hypothetical protein